MFELIFFTNNFFFYIGVFSGHIFHTDLKNPKTLKRKTVLVKCIKNRLRCKLINYSICFKSYFLNFISIIRVSYYWIMQLTADKLLIYYYRFV